MDKKKLEEVRLNRFIAMCGICSRRKADSLIQQGLVRVNKKVIVALGYKVRLTDFVEVNGQQIYIEKNQYLLLNKPKGYITTMSDEKNRLTVMDLINNACQERLFPVGRLDKETTGLLLFTNDGILAKKLMHPKHNVKKTYNVFLNKKLSKPHFSKIIQGLHLDDGFVRADKLNYLSDSKRNLQIEIHVGKNRIVRRIFSFLGYEVQGLDRCMYSILTKKKLPLGKWRMLTSKELNFFKTL